MQEWFESWFDTEYYHQLYAHRDDHEAQLFINEVLHQLKLPLNAKVLDNACGRGRHAKYLATLGYQVTGLDLSPQSILYAQKEITPGVNFAVHDMREIYKENYFDAVFNLFTSFGYFDQPSEDAKIINAIYQQLKPRGFFVLDFFNSHLVKEMISSGSVQVDLEMNGIVYQTTKSIQNDQVVKNIKINDHGKILNFKEQVKLWNETELVNLIVKEGFKVLHTYGNYQLDTFDAQSPRCIFICQK